MENNNVRLTKLVEICRDYCAAVENCNQTEKEEFIVQMTDFLPHIYWEFADLDASRDLNADIENDGGYFATYVDEDFYNDVRQRVMRIMGEDDTFLETFEEDMKYSDTPIAATVSECLADLFQNLYDFVESVHDGGEEILIPAYQACKDNFALYWGQTLCNVLRALHPLRFSK